MPSRVFKVEILGEARQLNRTLDQVDTKLGRFEKTTKRVGQATAGLFAGGLIVQGLKTVAGAAQEAAAIGRQTDAVIKSTGGAAGLSARGFSALATQISKTAAVDDDLVQGGENILATFTNIKASGPDKIFQRAEQAAVDMAAAMGHGEVTAEGLQTANVQLGKALNDPIKGMTALQKVGVTFSAQQREQIKDFVKHGQLAKAQGVILAEVNKEFGGSAAAAATSSKRFGVAVGNLEESLGGALVPTMEHGAAVAAGLAEGFTSLDKASGGLASKVLLGAAGIAGIGVAVGKTVKFVNETKTAWVGLRAAKLADVAVTPAVVAAEGATGAGAAASGAAAATAASRWTLLAGSVARFAGPAAIAIGAIAGIKIEHDRYNATQREANKLSADQADLAMQGIGPGGFITGTRDAVKAATGAWKDYNAKQAAALPGLVASGLAATTGADHFTRMAAATRHAAAAAGDNAKATAAMKAAHERLLTAVDAARSAVEQENPAFEGASQAAHVSAESIIRSMNEQFKQMRDMSKNMRILLKRGVDPAVVQELAAKGPGYVAAFAHAGKGYLGALADAWKARHAAMEEQTRLRTGQAAEDYRKLKEKANAETAKIKAAKARTEGREAAVREMRVFAQQANRAVDSIHGKHVSVTADAKVSLAASTISYLRTFHVKAPQLAGGGPVTGQGGPRADNQLRWLSPGEFVVNAAASSRHRALLEAINAPRMARGGRVGEFGDGLGRVSDADALATAHMGQALVGKVAATLGGALGRAIDKAAQSFGFGAPGGALGRVFALGRRQLGKPYRWGATGPGSFDCSGLIWYLFKHAAGISLPRTTGGEWAGLPRGGNAPGQLVLFDRGNIHHVGLVLGGNRMLNAPHTGANVRVQSFAGRSIAGYRNPWRTHAPAAGVTSQFGGRVQLDSGGTLAPGWNLAYNGTGRPEPLVPARGGDGARLVANVTVPLTVIGDITPAQRAQMAGIARDMGERVARELSDALDRRGSGV